MQKRPFLYGFKVIRPKYELKQDELLEWLAEANALSERSHTRPLSIVKNNYSSNMEMRTAQAVAPKVRDGAAYHAMFQRFGCNSKQIEYRGFECKDFSHKDFDNMELMSFGKKFKGEGFGERMKVYSKSAERIVAEFYENSPVAPEQIIHVSCTGYESPSAVQKIISKKQWGKSTSSVHAYHMGCYAAFPAMNLAAGRVSLTGGEKPVDIVHTEMCGLHLDASVHTAEQLVIQSLFADGFIRYSMVGEDSEIAKANPGFLIGGFLERMVENTSEAMTWVCSDFGLKMTLDRDVPGLIADDAQEFCNDLAKLAGYDFAELHKNAIFAIHPGGPKIVSAMQDLLRLENHQLKHSRETLKRYGNMSSATVPHMLEMILNDPSVADGTPIVTMAFGPGLTMYGSVLIKRS